MRKLELKYEIKNMSTLYEEASAPWQNAEFTSNTDFTASLRLWEDGIEPEQMSETLRRLEERAESFRVALKYLGNATVEFKKAGCPTYYFDKREFTPRTEQEMAIITDYLRGRRETFISIYGEFPVLQIHMTVTSSPAPLPSSMPFIPSNLHGMAEILIVAADLSKYPDLALKLAFLILEDLKGKNNFDKDELKIKHTRDFVSHPICYNPDVVAFVEAELPSARLGSGVQFRRNDNDHIAFVAKYACPALRRAKELFNGKVRAEGSAVSG